MSIKSQQQNMRTIYSLVSQDLGYISGERESGPNGEKKQFLTKSAAFLRALGRDLHFKEMRVTTNPAGIAVSGEVSLYGMWNNGDGLYMQITQPVVNPPAFLYRHITNMKDYSGGQNQWMSCHLFEEKEYDRVLYMLGCVREKPLTGADRYVA